MQIVIDIDEEDYERLKEYKKAPFRSLTSRAYEAIANGTPLPKTGHWIKTSSGFKCSRCLIVHSHPSIFCPSCGAKMIEPQERSDKE